MIDIVNIKNLNKYETIYASLGMDQNKGIVYSVQGKGSFVN